MTESIIEMMQKYSWILLVMILVLGWFLPVFMFITFICMVAPVVFSFKYGRAWCGNFCPRGSFNNNVLRIISPGKKIPAYLKKPVVRLAAFVLLMTLFTYNLINANGSIFGIGMAFIRMMAITTLIEICMAVFINQNAWCAICPMGTVAGYSCRIRGRSEGNVSISENCTGCNSCQISCPIQIGAAQYKEAGYIADFDCMKCRSCIKKCPQGALRWDMD